MDNLFITKFLKQVYDGQIDFFFLHRKVNTVAVKISILVFVNINLLADSLKQKGKK